MHEDAEHGGQKGSWASVKHLRGGREDEAIPICDLADTLRDEDDYAVNVLRLTTAEKNRRIVFGPPISGAVYAADLMSKVRFVTRGDARADREADAPQVEAESSQGAGPAEGQ